MQLPIFHMTPYEGGEKERERDGSNSCRNWHTQGNKCYFVPVLRWRCDGMVFHSLKNQTFRGGKQKSSQRKRRGTVIKRSRQATPRYWQGAGKEVSSERLKERRRSHFNHVVIVWSKRTRPGLTIDYYRYITCILVENEVFRMQEGRGGCQNWFKGLIQLYHWEAVTKPDSLIKTSSSFSSPLL